MEKKIDRDNKRIVAKRVIVIQKNGLVRVEYTHITQIRTQYEEGIGDTIIIIGETNDTQKNRIQTVDKYSIHNLELMIVDWYIPKV